MSCDHKKTDLFALAGGVNYLNWKRLDGGALHSNPFAIGLMMMIGQVTAAERPSVCMSIHKKKKKKNAPFYGQMEVGTFTTTDRNIFSFFLSIRLNI